MAGERLNHPPIENRIYGITGLTPSSERFYHKTPPKIKGDNSVIQYALPKTGVSPKSASEVGERLNSKPFVPERKSKGKVSKSPTPAPGDWTRKPIESDPNTAKQPYNPPKGTPPATPIIREPGAPDWTRKPIQSEKSKFKPLDLTVKIPTGKTRGITEAGSRGLAYAATPEIIQRLRQRGKGQKTS